MNLIDLAKSLITIPSITPQDLGCQSVITEYLSALGFKIETLEFDGVRNFYATIGNQAKPLFVFAGHTDVVPPGNIDLWDSDPFTPEIRDNHLYGRGAADMKSAIAAMLISSKCFLEKHPNFQGQLGFLITGDEEGEAENGTKRVIEHLNNQGIQIDYCLIGEATSTQHLGDGIKIGRRGSLHGTLLIQGKQGHIAYPQHADNAIHKSFSALKALAEKEWDTGNEYFPPTSFQIYHIEGGAGANNVIPGELTVKFNFRYASCNSAESLITATESILNDHELDYHLHWHLSGEPFLSNPGTLTRAVKSAIQEICDRETLANTFGGTSDGRFIAPTGAEVIELGPINESIHKVNERVSIDDLETLARLYERTLEKVLACNDDRQSH